MFFTCFTFSFLYCLYGFVSLFQYLLLTVWQNSTWKNFCIFPLYIWWECWFAAFSEFLFLLWKGINVPFFYRNNLLISCLGTSQGIIILISLHMILLLSINIFSTLFSPILHCFVKGMLYTFTVHNNYVFDPLASEDQLQLCAIIKYETIITK